LKSSTASKAPARLIPKAYRAIREEAKPSLELLESVSENSTIGVLDSFSRTPTEPSKHGDWVHDVIVNAGFDDDQVVKIENSTGRESNKALADLLFADSKEPFGQRLDAYIETSACHMLAKTNGSLKQIVAQPSLPFRTLNQSQGNSRVDIYRLLNGAAFDWSVTPARLTSVGEKMAKECGLEPTGQDFSPLKLRQSFVERVSEVIGRSERLPALQSEHSHLLATLRDRDVVMVKSAGNSADDLQDLRQQGLTVPEDFDDDLTAVGDKLVVGAFFNPGKGNPKDNQMAYFSSQYSAVKVLANGFNVPTSPGRVATGTSFAAPQVSSTLEKTRRAHPDWSLSQLEVATISEFQATDGFNLL